MSVFTGSVHRKVKKSLRTASVRDVDLNEGDAVSYLAPWQIKLPDYASLYFFSSRPVLVSARGNVTVRSFNFVPGLHLASTTFTIVQ